jgi:hypothetical protein
MSAPLTQPPPRNRPKGSEQDMGFAEEAGLGIKKKSLSKIDRVSRLEFYYIKIANIFKHC